ncbi:putative phospholipid hydroperoxide glutathione peroxidase [Asimina triloba]
MFIADARDNDVNLSIYKGKVLLIVNVASQWCAFGGQEPGNNEQVMEFTCTRFKAEFPIFDKARLIYLVLGVEVDVDGSNAAPLYKFLKSSKGGIFGDRIKWNFSKFLVDKDGHVVHRYAPTTSPLSIEVARQFLLTLALISYTTGWSNQPVLHGTTPCPCNHEKTKPCSILYVSYDIKADNILARGHWLLQFGIRAGSLQ